MRADVTIGALNACALGIALMANWIFGRRIKPISGAHPTPLTPPALAFSIWGLLYALLIAVCVAQFYDPSIVRHLSGWFALSCAGTIAWLMAYTRTYLKSATIILVLTTASIGLCYGRVQVRSTWQDAAWSRVIASVTFSLYFGWTLVATALNTLQASHLQGRVGHTTLQIAGYTMLYAVVAGLAFSRKDPCIVLPLGWAALWRGVWMREALPIVAGTISTLSSVAVVV